MDESPSNDTTSKIISDKGSTKVVITDHEEIWDRTPILSRMNSMECWDYTIELECLNGPQDLQLAAELGKTLLERNKELENLLRSQQRKCDDQKQEIEYLTKQNLALKEVNDSRMQIYETLDVSIRDLEIEKHALMVQTSNDKKLVKSLKQNIETLELRCEEISKHVEDLTQNLELERRKSERLRENVTTETTTSSKTTNIKLRHISSASETENEEASTPTNPNKSFTSSGQDSSNQLPFINYSQDYSSIQPVYSHDMLSHDSGFKTENSSNSAEHDELLKIMSELEDTKQQYMNEHSMVAELEHQLSVLAQENHNLQSRLVQANTLDEMKSVHEELSFLEEVRQGQMCTRCLKNFDCRIVPTENTSYIGTEGDEGDDRSLMDLLQSPSSQQSPTSAYRSGLTLKDDETSSQVDDPKCNPYKELVEKYEKLLELKRSTCSKQQQQPEMVIAPQSLHDELLNSGEFSSFNTKYTSDDEKKTSTGATRKTPTDYSETETASSGFSDETSTKATQTEEINPGSFLFSIADGEDCKFTIYDDAAPIENRFRDRPRYRELFKEIFTVLKKAAENKEEGEKLPLLDDDKQPATESSKVPPVTPATEEMPYEFDSQSMISSAISENSVAVSECVTKTERKKAKSQKKQAIKEESENKPPTAVQMVAGKLVTPYNRLALDLSAIAAKKRARRNRQRSKDKYGGGRDSSVCSNASSISNQAVASSSHQDVDTSEAKDSSTLTRNKKSRRHRELLHTISTIGASEWNGNTVTVYNQKISRNNPSHFFCRPTVDDNTSEVEFKHSAASHELKKLKKLDLSYAEVLRQADRRYRKWK
ncbi:CLUMA_CG006598, isoform A [Clunio marinus]|uniref:CLUMA_CG006598, isoform A n=1 Tax=Clunio marinus TaxID=568069 RepID=A0A1J1HYQ6_9DIPT|nr:CLUMA_CG006598, isoform A [Clunio marinus]